MKYVKVLVEDQSLPEVFIFSKGINHDYFHEHLMHLPSADNPLGEYYHAKTAGFIYPNFTCFGRSETLNLDSNEADNEIIASQLATGMNYVVASNETDNHNPHMFVFPIRISVEDFFKNLRTVRIGSAHNWRRVDWTLVSSGIMGADLKCSIEADDDVWSRSFYGYAFY